MRRRYEVEVVAKWEGTHGYGSITLRPPSINGADLDVSRPWRVDRTTNGAPVTIDVSPEEMSEVEVGSLFSVTLDLIR
jgi:hypothetical protein